MRKTHSDLNESKEATCLSFILNAMSFSKGSLSRRDTSHVVSQHTVFYGEIQTFIPKLSLLTIFLSRALYYDNCMARLCWAVEQCWLVIYNQSNYYRFYASKFTEIFCFSLVIIRVVNLAERTEPGLITGSDKTTCGPYIAAIAGNQKFLLYKIMENSLKIYKVKSVTRELKHRFFFFFFAK